METPTAQSPASISVRDLHKAYGTQLVLKGVSLEVKPGEIFVLMGPSGSGKSVLLRHLIGLEKADSGSALIGDLDASDPQTHQKISSGIVFQSGALFNSMSVYDNLALYHREHRLLNEAQIRVKVENAMESLDLQDAAKKIPAELSGGMRKRVAVARAIIMEPQIILYDEPTSELDPLTSATVSELIADVRDRTGATSFVVTHDRDLTAGIADHTALLIAGEIVFKGSPEELHASTHPEVAAFMHPKIKKHPLKNT